MHVGRGYIVHDDIYHASTSLPGVSPSLLAASLPGVGLCDEEVYVTTACCLYNCGFSACDSTPPSDLSQSLWQNALVDGDLYSPVRVGICVEEEVCAGPQVAFRAERAGTLTLDFLGRAFRNAVLVDVEALGGLIVDQVDLRGFPSSVCQTRIL